MADFDNKAVIVTGGASGIGLACAQLFAEKGAKVVISDIADAQGEEAAARIRRSGGWGRSVVQAL